MKFATKLLLNYLFFSLLSFAVIILAANKAIDYYSFVTIEKQMMEKVDMCELSFREVLTKHENSTTQPDDASVFRDVMEVLKSSGKEVRIYDKNLKLLGYAVDGILVNEGTPAVFPEHLRNAMKGNYAYTVTDRQMIYFAIPIQDRQYQNVYVLELVENIAYYYAIMDKIRSILLMGAGGFMFLITLASLYIAHKTTNPIKYLLGATEKFSKQQFEPVHLNRKDELGMLAAGLNHMGNQLNSYIQYQKQFISNVSHELKTPLAAIRGFSQYLYEGENQDEESKKIYSHLMNESDRLTKLVNELLMLSRFDKASHELQTEKMDLAEIAEEIVRALKSKAEAKEIAVEVQLQKEIFIDGNKILMSHAISNVLENAIKYSNKKSSIKVEAFSRLQEAVVRITDHGIGIPKEELASVQERFYRASNSNVASGSGLGLSICKEIVEKFEGQLMIQSEVKIGTTVTMVFPYK